MKTPYLFAVSWILLFSSATAQTGPGAPGSREAMWPAPTAEDWARPCLITWQRSYDDALAVSRETGKPILVCVNMDGEIASEHYAGIRYRQPEIAKLYEPYVTVIASVYRHNPRDYDEEGNRILCPRFGSVTCGEHISIEPGLFDQFFEGQRVAPRHIGVELDSGEFYDVYYAFDTDSVFQAIKDGVKDREPVTDVRGDRPIVERVESRDIRDRIAVEAAYAEGDRAMRQQLVEAALQHGEAEQVDLLRLAIFGYDMELSKLARQALAQTESPGSTDLILEALRVPMETAERDALVGALGRIGEESPRARTLETVHRGLAGRSAVIDLDGWSLAFEGAPAAAGGDAMFDAQMGNPEEVLGSNDALQHVDLAEAFLARGINASGQELRPRSDQKLARLLFLDARSTALEAEKLGATGWRVNAIIGLAAYYLGDRKEAYDRSEVAVMELPVGEMGWNAMAVLDLFARRRWQAVASSVMRKRTWPSEWLTDVHAAFSVLGRHPYGNQDQAVLHYDILNWLGAGGQATRVLDAALNRFPASWDLHERLRTRSLKQKGLEGLEAVYEAMLRRDNPTAELVQYAGYASLVTAEFHRRYGQQDKALAAYARGIAHYQRAIEIDPESRDACEHFVAMAIAGRARIAFETGDYETSLAELLSSFERREDAAATLDGLGISAVATARMLLARLVETKQEEAAAKLEAALDNLDPVLLELPAFERGGQPSPDVRGSGRRPGRRRGR